MARFDEGSIILPSRAIQQTHFMAFAQSALRSPANPKKIGAGTTEIRKLIIGGELMRE